MRILRHAFIGAALALLWAFPLQAQSSSKKNDTLRALNQCVVIEAQGMGTGAVGVAGTWAGTVTFTVSTTGDSSDYTAVNMTPPNSSTQITTTTGNGQWSGSIAGYRFFRACMTSYTSGLANVTLSTAATGGGGGGSATITADTLEIDLTGTATEAKQDTTIAKMPSLGTAGSPSTNVISVQGVASGTALPVSGTITGTGGTFPVTDSGGSLTVDAPVGTPAFVRLSDGTSAITTLPVSLASVPSHAVTNAGTFATQPNFPTTASTSAVSVRCVNAAGNTFESCAGAGGGGSGEVTNAGTFAVQAAQAGTWTVQPGNTANTTAWLVTGTGGVFPATQSGAWNVTNISGTVSLPTGASTAANQATEITALQLIDDVVFAEDVAATAADKGVSILAVRRDADTSLVGADNDYANLQVNAGGQLKVACITGCAGSGGTSIADDAAFTVGTTSLTPVGGIYRSTLDTVNDGDAGTFAMLANRIQMTHLVDASGVSLVPSQDQTEDVASVGGETGPMVLAIRRDADTTLVGTDGDFAPLQVNAAGSLKVAITAGGGGGTQYTQDAALTVATSVMTMSGGRASAAAPTDVTADNDAVMPWYLRSGAQAIQPTFAGVLATTGNGAAGTGVQRVTIASDSTGQIALAAGSATIGALTANQSVNVAQINGVTPLMGAGNTGTGSARVTLATDQAALVGFGIYVEDAAETAAGNLAMAGSVRRDTAASSAGTAGDNATVNTDSLGRMWTRPGSPCSDFARVQSAPISTASAANNQLVALNGSDLIYICGFSVIADGATAVQFIYGTGTACATGETDLTGPMGLVANTGWALSNGGATQFAPIPAGNAFCIENSNAVQISGHVAYVRTATP